MPRDSLMGRTARTVRLDMILNTVERENEAGRPGDELAIVRALMRTSGLRQATANEHLAFLVELGEIVRTDRGLYVKGRLPKGAKIIAVTPGTGASSGPALQLEPGAAR